MAQLSRLPPKPRSVKRRPSYPRALGVGIAVLVSACGGESDSGARFQPEPPEFHHDGSATFGGGVGGGTGGSTWSDPTADAKVSAGGGTDVGGSGGDPWGGGIGGGGAGSGWDEDAAFGGAAADAGAISEADAGDAGSDGPRVDATSD